MNFTNRILFTKILVIGGVFLSLGSIITDKNEIGDLYPFFHWKLYTQPMGSKNEIAEYRIYAKKINSQSFHRLTIRPTYTFNEDDYAYSLNDLTARVLKDSINVDLKSNLLDFIKHVEPDYETYKVVEEKYNPLDVYKDIIKYDTTTIVRF